MTADDGRGRRPPLWWILLRHEWRLTTRDFGGRSRRAGEPTRGVGRRRRILGIVAVAVLLHAAGAASLLLPPHWIDTQASRLAAAALMLLLFTLMLSIAMSRVVAAFHERRDLDLLLSAPVPPATILVVRAATVVVAVGFLFAVFLYPLADVGIASGRWWLARLYPLVPLMAMTATAVALALTGAVVRLIGVRRARVGLQVFSALVGASFYLVSQARQFLPAGLSQAVLQGLHDATRDDRVAWAIRVVGRLARGDASAWLLFAIAATALFAASVGFARKRFAEIAQTPDADAPTVAARPATVERRIAAGFARHLLPALLQKEWRSILRAPQLISQILLQLLYLMPLLLVAFGHADPGTQWTTAALVAGLVGVAGTLTASLAWLTVSAEDAPDLLAGSPKAPATILAAKLLAAAGPPVAILALAAVATMRRSVVDGAIVLGFGTLACLGAAILEAATPSPGKRSDFQRRQKGRGLSAVVDGMQFLLWAAAAGTAASGWWIVALALAAAASIAPAIRLPRALARMDRPSD